ncbi:MAG TPA: hypothetical protein VKB80_09540 [Kofleriaceae bacterium]|nr:hypothetical protein [Kofleriaceae bacterium]
MIAADRSRSPDLAVAVALGAVGYLLGGLGPCLILLARDLRVPRGQLTWLTAGVGGALLLLGVAGPWLLGARPARVLRASAAGLAAGLALLAAAPTLRAAQLGALLIGLGAAGMVLVNPALLAGPGMAARLSRVNAVSSLATVSAPLLISAADPLTGSGRLALLLPLPALVWLLAAPLRQPDAAPSAALPAAPALPARPPASASLPGPVAPRAALGWCSLVFAVSAEFAFLVWSAARLEDAGLGVAGAAAAAAGFPIGMACGRIAAPLFMRALPVEPLGAGLAMAAAVVVAAPVGPAAVTAAIAAAGLGISLLYPITLARLVSTPGLGAGRGAALGAAASGTAALLSPILLDAVASRASLRASFLVVIPLLLAMLALQLVAARRTAGAAADG